MIRGLVGSYQQAWQDSDSSARWFLTSGLFFAIRILAFSVSFPLYAKAKGFDSGQIGLLLGAVAFSLFIFGIPVTKLGASGYSRQLLLIGPLIGAAGIAIVLATPPDLFILTVFGCLLVGMSSNVFWVLGDPILARSVAERSRAHIFAFKFAILTVGFGIGGLLGGWVPAILERTGRSEEAAFAGALILVLLLDLVQTFCYWHIPKSAVRPRGSRIEHSTDDGRPVGRVVWVIFVLMLVPEFGMAIGYNSVRPYLSLFFDETYGLAAGKTGTLIGVMQLVGGFGALLIPSLAAKHGRIPTAAALRVVGGTAIALALGAASLPIVVAMFFLHFSVTDGTGATFVTEAMTRLPDTRRTAFAGLAAMTWSLASAIAASVSGFLQGATDGFTAAFLFGVFGYFFSAAWLFLAYPRIPSLLTGARKTSSPVA